MCLGARENRLVHTLSLGIKKSIILKITLTWAIDYKLVFYILQNLIQCICKFDTVYFFSMSLPFIYTHRQNLSTTYSVAKFFRARLCDK